MEVNYKGRPTPTLALPLSGGRNPTPFTEALSLEGEGWGEGEN